MTQEKVNQCLAAVKRLRAAEQELHAASMAVKLIQDRWPSSEPGRKHYPTTAGVLSATTKQDKGQTVTYLDYHAYDEVHG